MLLLLILALFGLLRQRKIGRRPLAQTPLDPKLAAQRAPWHRTRAKPPWVGDELVRMKAFGKNLGYKKLADAFNRRFVDALAMSVAPSTVRRILIKRRADTAALERLLLVEYERLPTLYRPLVTDRNRRWLPQIEALLARPDDTLVVVGALHLVGPDGLLALLRERGLVPSPVGAVSSLRQP